MQCSKQMATDLHRELAEILKAIPSRIEEANSDGPLLTMICESLGKAISALKTQHTC